MKKKYANVSWSVDDIRVIRKYLTADAAKSFLEQYTHRIASQIRELGDEAIGLMIDDYYDEVERANEMERTRLMHGD